MKTERHKMLAGELYDPMDTELVAARRRAIVGGAPATRRSRRPL
jgi:maltose acetyltransferase-like protein